MSHERFLLLSSVWEKKRKKKLIRLIFLQKIAIILSVKYVYAKLISDFFVIVYQFYPTEVWNIFQVAWKIYSSSRPEAFLKISQNSQENNCVGVPFFFSYLQLH